MKGYQHWGRRMVAALLAGSLLAGGLPAAAAADAPPTTRLHLTPPAEGQTQDTAFIQEQFNQSVIGYGAAGNSGSNVEGPNKLWDGPASAGTTDHVKNGNLTIIPAEDAGGADYVEDTGVFRFYLHDREDYDSTGVRYDRQRIEIKSHDRSDSKAENAPALAMEDEIYTYRWKFKLPDNCYTPLSANQEEQLANFFHIFQLKAIRGGENAMPVATFTIEDNYLMFQQIPISGRGMGYNHIIGDKIPLKEIEGKWLSATVTVLYRDEGYIHVKLDDLETGRALINEGAELDTWRRPELGEGATAYESDFPAIAGQGIRCKWGLYRKYIPDAYRLDPEAGGNSAIDEAALPSWWKDATMWVGDIEVKKEDRNAYAFPAAFEVGDYTLPGEGEDLVEHTSPMDGGVNYAANASIKICSKENNSHDGKPLLDGNDTTTWDTAKSMLDTDAANQDKVYWAALDLGAPQDINKFMIQFSTTSNKLCGYQIYYAGADGKAAYDEIVDCETDDPRKLNGWDAWTAVEGAGYHPGVNKYVKAYQMNIFDAASGDFDPLEEVRYLLIVGDIVHDNSEKSIKTAIFKAINTNEQPEIPATGYDRGENLASGAGVSLKVSTSSEYKVNDTSLSPKEYTSQFLIDNDDNTLWATNSSQVNGEVVSAGYKYWAAIDLGKTQEINLFRIKWGTVSSRLASYQVFYSNEDADFNSLVERNGTINLGTANQVPTRNPIEEAGSQWQPATHRVESNIANHAEAILPVEANAQMEAEFKIEQGDLDPEPELEPGDGTNPPSETQPEAKPETTPNAPEAPGAGSETQVIPENPDTSEGSTGSNESEVKPPVEDSEDNACLVPEANENLPLPQDKEPVYAALPSMFGTFARATAVSDRDAEMPSIEARYLLLLCDVNTDPKPGAINTASFEAFYAAATAVAVESHAEKLGMIKMLPGLEKDAILSALLPQRFSVKLTGNITYALPVEWDKTDIAGLDPDKPGAYEIHGTLIVPDGVTLDFDTNAVSKAIVRMIVVEEAPVKDDNRPPVEPEDPDGPQQPGGPEDPDGPQQPGGPEDPDRPQQPDPSGSNNGSAGKPSRPAITPQVVPSAETEKPEKSDDGPPSGSAPSQAPRPPASFRDVQQGDWFRSAVEYVSSRGMMNGSGNDFRPNERLTRGMIAQVLYNLEGGKGGSLPAFSDVAANDWYAAAVGWVSQNGVMSGYSNGLFGADDPIAREQLAMTLYRYAQLRGFDLQAAAGLSAFVDGGSVSDWAQPAMKWAVANGLISGKSGSRLDAQGTATRAEVASILMRFCETFGR